MSALETSIGSLTAEHTALTQKLEQIDQQYRVDRPALVKELNQLARALSALTGKPVPGATGSTARKVMSEEGKAAIRAGLERARLAKKEAAVQTQPTPPPSTAKPNPTSLTIADVKRDVGEKPAHRR